MAFTQADIDAMDRLIASGASEVQFSDGRRVRYNSLDEKVAARAIMSAEVSQSTSGRTTVAAFDRG